MVRLYWPPNSPHLNPIKKIWSYMKDIIAKDYTEVSSAQDMKIIVQRMRGHFGDEKCDNLIESVLERMEAVTIAGDGSIRF